jgi:hypothetical protein
MVQSSLRPQLRAIQFFLDQMECVVADFFGTAQRQQRLPGNAERAAALRVGW